VSGTRAVSTNPLAAAERLPYGEGIFRRRYRLRAGPGLVVADMEDDFHRFRAELAHDGERVTAVRGEALRHPWTECAGAAAKLRALEGMPLSPRFGEAAHHADPRANCTHLFDLAGMAVTHAHAGRGAVQIDITVPDCDARGRTRPTLHRDGALLLAWETEHLAITAPAPFAGHALRGRDLPDWADACGDAALGEAVLLLRRGFFISMGRARNMDEAPDATVYMPLTAGSCHSFTPGIAEKALRVKGSGLDFTDAPEALLADLAD